MLSLLILTPATLPDAAALAALRTDPGAPGLYVRVEAAADLAEALRPGADGVAADIRSRTDLARLANRLAVREAEAGLPDGASRILALVESAAGVLGLSGLVGASPRLAGLVWDAQAVARDLGVVAARAWPAPLAQARGQVVLAARAAGVPAFATVRGADAALAEALAAARRDGFAGLAARDAAYLTEAGSVRA